MTTPNEDAGSQADVQKALEAKDFANAKEGMLRLCRLSFEPWKNPQKHAHPELTTEFLDFAFTQFDEPLNRELFLAVIKERLLDSQRENVDPDMRAVAKVLVPWSIEKVEQLFPDATTPEGIHARHEVSKMVQLFAHRVQVLGLALHDENVTHKHVALVDIAKGYLETARAMLDGVGEGDPVMDQERQRIDGSIKRYSSVIVRQSLAVGNPASRAYPPILSPAGR